MAKKKRYYGGKKMKGSGMLSADMNAIANMPQKSFIKMWPKATYGADYGLNDTIMYIDKQMKDDNKHKKSGPFPEKY